MTEKDVLSFDEAGLIPAVVQDEESGRVLMLGWMSCESIEQTYQTGRVTFWSRTRDELWEKGATSGNPLHFVSLHKNCEANALLVKARPEGPTCHTGHETCFYRPLDPAADLPADG